MIMKTIKFLPAILIISTSAIYGQQLIQYYQNETIRLEEVSEFGAMNNWNDLFSDYNDQWMGHDIGKNKHIVVAPDGSIFMSHHTTYAIWKFNKEGRLIKKFGEKGNGRGQFIMRAMVEGILDGKYLYTTDAQGRMMFFDLDGNFVKSLKLDYGPLHTVPLNNLKIAIFGSVPWRNNQTRNIISIKDFETGNEKIIWDEIHDPMLHKIELPEGRWMFFAMNIHYPSITRFGIAASSTGNLLVTSNKDGMVTEYSPDGKMIREFPLNIKPVEVTEADIRRKHQESIDDFNQFRENDTLWRRLTDEKIDAIRSEYEMALESKLEKIKAGTHLPFYSTVIVDSDGNILVFEFTEEEGANSFRAYSYDNEGELIGVSSFTADEYELTFTSDKFVFFNGYIFAVATKKDASGVPLRLVKFSLAR